MTTKRKTETTEEFRKRSREYMRKYKSDHYDEILVYKREYLRKWREKHGFDKEAPRKRLRYAVKTGKIKQLPCEVCGDPRSQGHHDDYRKALEVKWLCQIHHDAVHRELCTATI